jgi:hypothetical protein
MNDWCICRVSCIFLLGILIFKELTARRLYKSFGVKRLMHTSRTYLKIHSHEGDESVTCDRRKTLVYGSSVSPKGGSKTDTWNMQHSSRGIVSQG